MFNSGETMRTYLKKKREDNGFTQQYVAEKVGISTQYYSLIERGERKQEMNISMLCKLAEIFGVPVSELIAAERKFLNNEKL